MKYKIWNTQNRRNNYCFVIEGAFIGRAVEMWAKEVDRVDNFSIANGEIVHVIAEDLGNHELHELIVAGTYKPVYAAIKKETK